MVRTISAFCLIGLVAAMAGCRMCASPYDDCYPTYTGECGEPCNSPYRAGSIQYGESTTVTEVGSPTEALQPIPREAGEPMTGLQPVYDPTSPILNSRQST